MSASINIIFIVNRSVAGHCLIERRFLFFLLSWVQLDWLSGGWTRLMASRPSRWQTSAISSARPARKWLLLSGTGGLRSGGSGRCRRRRARLSWSWLDNLSAARSALTEKATQKSKFQLIHLIIISRKIISILKTKKIKSNLPFPNKRINWQ